MLLRARALFVSGRKSAFQEVLRSSWRSHIVVIMRRELLHVGVLAQTGCSDTSWCDTCHIEATILALLHHPRFVLKATFVCNLAVDAQIGKA